VTKSNVVLILTLFLMTFSVLPITHTVSGHPTGVPVIISFVSRVGEGQRLSIIRGLGGQVIRELRAENAVAAIIPSTRMQELAANQFILRVERDTQVRMLDGAADSQILANQVWPLGVNGTGVRLAILDTGIDTSHPEFTGRILLCHTEVPRTSTCEDDNGHGTHVAGIAGASGVNSAAKGVAPEVSFLIDKVLDSTGSGSLSQIEAGIEWAVAAHANIISMSLGTNPVDMAGIALNCDSVFPSLTEAVDSAVADGVTVVAAAGNAGLNGLGAPGCIGSVIAVGAVGSNDVLAYFSSIGAAMSDHGVVAPGVNIFSTLLSGTYETLSGTSMATPMVSGTAALVLSSNPSLSPSSVRNILFSTSDCVLLLCPNNDIGYGRIDALNAVKAALSGTQPSSFDFHVALSPASGSVTPGGSVQTTVTVSLAGGVSQTVSLSILTGSSNTITSSFSAQSGFPSFYSTMTIETQSNTPLGTHVITVQATGGGVTRYTLYYLDVSSNTGDFSISAFPSNIQSFQGGLASSFLIVAALNSFNATVA
jgi:subtilisin family serine protease